MPSSDGDGAPALLEARGLRRSFGALRVLRGVDLAVGPGEAVVVAGANGAGKTTLLRILAGLTRPEAGEVRVLGHPVRGDDPAGRRGIGFVSHQSLLYDDLTLAQNLTFAARLYRLPRPGEAAREALSAAGLGGRADDSPRRLSRGSPFPRSIVLLRPPARFPRAPSRTGEPGPPPRPPRPSPGPVTAAPEARQRAP